MTVEPGYSGPCRVTGRTVPTNFALAGALYDYGYQPMEHMRCPCNQILTEVRATRTG